MDPTRQPRPMSQNTGNGSTALNHETIALQRLQPLQNTGKDTAAPRETAPQRLDSSHNPDNDTTSSRETTYSDPSGAIFSMYLTRASKFDDEDVENWKGGADGILVFTGLFSSTVASLIALSYPTLQPDPNATVESLLANISQQLGATANSTLGGRTGGETPFSPPASAVFINSVWFLSLVLSLTCALIATLLQQWARGYRQIIQRNHAPHVRAHIREYLSRGAHKFGIFGLVKALPLLLLISVFLFFAGLVAFAFRANHIVAYSTVAIVGFCFLSYIAFTAMPLIFDGCPYYTPFTSLILYFTQKLLHSFFSVLYHGANQLHVRWGTVNKSVVESFLNLHKNAKSFSGGMTSKLENSAQLISIGILKAALVRTIHWLSEDRDLEDFADGIPGLCGSNALTRPNNGDTPHTIRDVLAALPGPIGFHASLPWSIIQLAQRAFTSKLPKTIQQRRIRVCLRALYYIPGGIRDILAPYAAWEGHFSKILPLLDSTESLEIIDGHWDTPNDVTLPVRCAAAVVTAFRITPRRTLDNFSTPNVGFIWDEQQFLTKRLRDGADRGAGPEFHPRSDSARLQNIVRFLKDIKEVLREINKQWWSSSNAELIRLKRKELLKTRRDRTEGYRANHCKFDQQLEDDRKSPAFVPAAQLDLITITLEILARDPVAGAATSQREAFHVAYEEFEQVAFTQAKEQAKEQRLGQPLAQSRLLSESDQEALAWMETQAGDSIAAVKHALGPVMQSLLPQTNELQAPQIASLPSNSTDGGPASARNTVLPPSSPSDSGPSSSERPSPATGRLDIESRGSPS